MTNALISIIVTCYNQAHCITQTLESLKGQTYTHWECIIVDDGSIDTSAEVIQTLIQQDQRFHYVYQENAGVSMARNAGFALAKGEFINFLDGDDTFLPEKLEKQIQVFEKYPEVAICICDHQYYHVHTNDYKYYQFEGIKSKPLKQLLYGWHNGVAFPPHAPLYQRSLWSPHEIPFPKDYQYRCEDWVFNVLVALKHQNYYMLDKVLCNYHMTLENYTSNKLELSAAAIQAAIYLNPLLPKEHQNAFVEFTIKNSLKMYLDSEKINILKASKNWLVANAVSKFVFKIIPYKKS